MLPLQGLCVVDLSTVEFGPLARSWVTMARR